MEDHPEHEFELERRIRHLEREFAQVQVLLGMQANTINEIRDAINSIRDAMKPTPVNIPAWIGATIGTLSLFGGLLYTAFIAPLGTEISSIKEYGVETRAYLRDVGDYAKETRAIVDERKGVHDVDNGTD